MRKLKRGSELFETTTEDQYLLGTHKRAIRIYTIEQKTIALALLAGHDISKISETAGVSEIAVHNLAVELEKEKLLDTEERSITISNRYQSKISERARKNSKPERDAGFTQLQNRTRPELSQTTWRDECRDGGVGALNARQNFLIEISGKNRVAPLLYPLLIASGFSNVRFAHNENESGSPIRDLDIGLPFIREGDGRTSRERHLHNHRRFISLFPIDGEESPLEEFSTPDLRIHCGEVDPEKISLWMSTGKPFLYIASPRADKATIGPLVIPGISPCIRCCELTNRDQLNIREAIGAPVSAESDYPMIGAYFVAALAASQIAQYCDNQFEVSSRRSAELIGGVFTVDYQLLAQTRLRSVARHPNCGCSFR